MSVFQGNLRYLRSKAKMSQQAFADAIHITRGQYQKYEDGISEAPYMILIRIATHYHITTDLLLTADLTKVTLESMIKMGNNRMLLPITVDEKGENRIELVTHKAKAGYLAGYGQMEYIGNLPFVVLPFLGPEKYRGFPIDGDSMPPYNNKTFIFGKYVEKLAEIKDGKTYVVVDRTEGIVYKRLYKKSSRMIIAKSDNDFYKPYPIDGKELLEVWEFACAIMLEEFTPGLYTVPTNNVENMLLEIKGDLALLMAK